MCPLNQYGVVQCRLRDNYGDKVLYRVTRPRLSSQRRRSWSRKPQVSTWICSSYIGLCMNEFGQCMFQITGLLQFLVSLGQIFNLVPTLCQHCAYVLLRIWHKSLRVGKHLFCHHRHGWRCPDFPTKTSIFVTTNVVSPIEMLKRSLELQSPACQCLRHYPVHLQTLESGHKYVMGM